MPRDFQRSRVYKAERRHSQWTYNGGMELDEVKDFVKEICNSRWYKNRAGRASYIKVKDGRGRTHAGGNYHYKQVKLPRWSRSRMVILHELAHTAVNHDKVPAHGREFCGWYLALVRRFVSEDAYKELRQHMQDVGVKVGAMPKPRYAKTRRSR